MEQETVTAALAAWQGNPEPLVRVARDALGRAAAVQWAPRAALGKLAGQLNDAVRAAQGRSEGPPSAAHGTRTSQQTAAYAIAEAALRVHAIGSVMARLSTDATRNFRGLDGQEAINTPVAREVLGRDPVTAAWLASLDAEAERLNEINRAHLARHAAESAERDRVKRTEAVIALVGNLASRGVRLDCRDGRLVVRSASLLTPADRSAIADHRAEIVAILESTEVL